MDDLQVSLDDRRLRQREGMIPKAMIRRRRAHSRS
jgi:hypothetical protein